jgi:Endoglucanase
MDEKISRSRVKGFLKIDGRRTVNEDGEEVLLAGVGLGNWLLPEGYMWKFGGPHSDRPHRIERFIRTLAGSKYSEKFWREFRDSYVTRRDLELIAEAGFNSIRIPFNHSILLDDEPGINFREDGFALIDRVLAWCEELRLYVVLDLHGAPGGQTGSNIDDCFDDLPRLFIDPESRERALALWTEIARRYKDRWIVAAYDLLNEPLRTDLPHVPNTEYLHPELTRFYDDCIAAIRRVDTRHAVSLEGANWATRADTFYKRFDPLQIIHFHRYGNLPGEEAFAEWLALGEKFDCPLWLGESGENSREWYGAMYPQALAHGIGYNFWPWKRMSGNPVPLEIQQPAGWEKVTAFCKGGPRPTYAESQEIFDAYLENIKAENCVHDATVAGSILRHGSVRLMATDFDTGAGACSGCGTGSAEQKPTLLRYRGASGMDIKPRAGMVYSHGPGFQCGWEKLCLGLAQGEWAVWTFGGAGAKFKARVEGDAAACGVVLRVTETATAKSRDIALAAGEFAAEAEFAFEAPLPLDEAKLRVEIIEGAADLYAISIDCG